MAGRQIANLQGLRGLAAMLVVLYHIQPLLDRTYGLSFHSNFGVVGVDIFFVLSGFVMFYSNAQPEPGAAGKFLLLRFFRIVPLYWLATLAIVAFFLAGFRPVGLHELSPTILAQSMVFWPTSFSDGRHDLILTVGWTLMFELFFYLCFALTFPLKSLTRSLAALTVVFSLFALFGQLITPLPYWLDFLSSPITFEFLFGAATAIIYLRAKGGWPIWLPRAGLILLIAGLAIALIEDAAGMAVPNKHDARFLLLGLPALLIVSGALAMERGGWILKTAFMLDLGAASYVLYLFHPLILQLTVKIVVAIGLASPLIAALLALTACLVFAFAAHRWAEIPILSCSKQLLTGRALKSEPVSSALLIEAAE